MKYFAVFLLTILLVAATHTGVYLHGSAADSLAQSIGPYGYLAGDVMSAIPREIKKIAKRISSGRTQALSSDFLTT